MTAAVERARVVHLRERTRSRLGKFVATLGLVAFGFWSIDVLEIPLDRISGMFERLGVMLTERMLPPDLDYATGEKVLRGVLETIEMSLLGSFVGTAITIPLAWLAAWNVTPSRAVLYPAARLVIVLSRSLPTLMAAMLLVAVFGFGPFAGVLALVIGTVGFAGKLMAEQAEAIDMGPVEAIRATGAGPTKVFLYAVYPQVKPAWYGIIVYNWDARLRSSTILGFVGAGGIGLYLRERVSTLEYQGATGIIFIIILLVIGSEAISHLVRRSVR